MSLARWGITATLAALLLVLPAAAGARTAAPTLPPPGTDAAGTAPTRVIVSLREDAALRGAPQAYRTAIAARSIRVIAALPAGARVLRSYTAVPALVIELPAGAIDALAQHPDVAAVTPDGPIRAQLGESAEMIGAYDVHADLDVTGAGVTVAVLDTGIDTDHPALAGDLQAQGCFLITGGCPTTAGVPHGCPATPATTTGPWAEDGNGHGTHVAGIISSNGHDDGQDVGVAPGAAVKAFKVLNDCGGGDITNLVDAFEEILTSHPDVDIVNMSVGDGTSNAPGTCDARIPAMTSAVENARAAGIITFGSAGNSGAKAGIGYPGCISAVVSVGAVYDAPFNLLTWAPCTDANVVADQVTCFSQSGPDLDLLAPGALVESTFPGGGFLNLAGTSMASPAAAAVAALVLESEPSLTPQQLEARLALTGVPVTDAANGITTCRVQALKAVQNVGPLCLAPSLDSDGDGCSDAEEGTSNPMAGGARDALDPWDFFDVTGDQAIDLADALDVLGFFGDAALPATPADARDRWVPDAGAPWRTAEEDDGVDLSDALAALASYGHDCSGAP